MAGFLLFGLPARAQSFDFANGGTFTTTGGQTFSVPPGYNYGELYNSQTGLVPPDTGPNMLGNYEYYKGHVEYNSYPWASWGLSVYRRINQGPWGSWGFYAISGFTPNAPSVVDVNVTGSFMSPEDWSNGRFETARLGLYIKNAAGEWELADDYQSTDGTYSWTIPVEGDLEYEVRLLEYVVSLGDGIEPVTIPGNSEVLAGGTYQPPQGQPQSILEVDGTTTVPPSPPQAVGSSTSIGSNGEPVTKPVYQVPGANGSTHYVNPSTGTITTYSASGAPSVSTAVGAEMAKTTTSDFIGTSEFGFPAATPAPANPEHNLTTEQIQEGIQDIETGRDTLVGFIRNLEPPGMPSFGQSLTFTGSLPVLGSITVDLSPWSSIISSFREFVKFLLSIVAWVATIKIIRGSSV